MKKELWSHFLLIVSLSFLACDGERDKNEKSNDACTTVVKEQKTLLKDEIVDSWRMTSIHKEDQNLLSRFGREMEFNMNKDLKTIKFLYVFIENGKMWEEIDGKKIPDRKNVKYQITDEDGKEDFSGSFISFSFLDYKGKNKEYKTGRWEVLKISRDSLLVRDIDEKANDIIKFVRFKK